MDSRRKSAEQEHLLAYAKAWQLLASASDFSLEREKEVPLAKAVGRVLAEDLFLDRPEPPVDRSAMDGFAVRSEDGCQPRQIVGTLFAGTAGQPHLERGQAMAVMTGGTVPHGADAVIPVERTTREGEQLDTTQAPQPGQHVRRAGEMGQAGRMVLAAGTRLGPGELAVAASVGAARLTCARRPRVALFTTGDEVIPCDRQPEPHQVRDSNLPTCAALLRAAGAEVAIASHLADDEQELTERLAPALAEHDLVVTIGGVSMGEKDFLPQVFRSLGVEQLFHKINIQPGKPVWAGKTARGVVLGLPGNPVSGYVILSLFAPLILGKMMGMPVSAPWFLPAVLASPLRSGPRERFVPALLRPPTAPMGLPQLMPIAATGSGDWIGLAGIQVLAQVPPHSELAIGDDISYLPALGAS